MSATTRWGILATGNIARKFAAGLAAADGAELIAVGSRSREKAESFGDEFDIPRRHGSYEDLAADPDVDVIYVATPHPMHEPASLLCLDAGKAVLCEKPFTVNASQARRVIERARRKGLFLMEAMWTRFIPAIAKLREILAAGTIGEVRMMMADFGFRAPWNPEGRLLNPKLGGGGLLDVGVYPISLASMVLGRAERVASLAHLGKTGVDEQSGAVLGYPGGALALASSAVQVSTPRDASIFGTRGSIRLHHPWWRAEQLTVTADDKTETLEFPVKGNGYEYQAEEVGRCLAAGKTESDVMPLDETVAIMETMDQIRSQWGLTYPIE